MIKLENLQKNYDNFSLNIKLNLPEGKVSGLVGKNGAGKSTTIKAILGLIKIDDGRALVFDKNANDLSILDKQKIGVAFSDSFFSPYMYTKDIIKVLKKSYKNFDEKFFIEYCKKNNLALNKKIKEYSTGMKAKLRVLTAISHNADLLILDEPTVGLDVVARNEVIDIIRNYLAQDNKRTLLISSHISSDLQGLCDDIYLIHEGKIILHEDTDVILSEYAMIKVSDETYEKIDKTYIITTKKEDFGYSLFTNQKQYYQENYPEVIIESGNIDDVIIMMSQGGNE